MDIGLGTTLGAMNVSIWLLSSFQGGRIKFWRQHRRRNSGDQSGSEQSGCSHHCYIRHGYQGVNRRLSGKHTREHHAFVQPAGDCFTGQLQRHRSERWTNSLHRRAVQLLGRGGGSGDGNAGVVIDSSGLVQTGGDVTIQGRGAAGNNATASMCRRNRLQRRTADDHRYRSCPPSRRTWASIWWAVLPMVARCYPPGPGWSALPARPPARMVPPSSLMAAHRSRRAPPTLSSRAM